MEEYFTNAFREQPRKISLPTTNRSRIALHQQMWPSEMATRGIFANMVNDRRFECAELAFNDLDHEGIVFSDGLAKTVSLLSSASELAMWHRGMTSEEIRKLMEAWKAQFPSSIIADIYWIRLLNAAAWQARGSESVSQVSKGQWKEFDALNAEAATRIAKTSSAATKHYLWPYAVRWVMADSRVPKEKLQNYVFESLKRFPDEVDYLLLPAERLTEQWGGSPKEFEQYAQRALAATRETHGNKVYAKLYASYIPMKLLRANKYVQLETVRAGLVENTQQPFFPEAFDTLQDFACALRDRAAFEEAGKIAMSYTPSERAMLQPMDSSCRDWAIKQAETPRR